MQSKAATVEEYLNSLPEERQAAMRQLRAEILANLPEGFEEMMGYGMMGYAVPHSLYPSGYHCDPKQPLPFMGMASQKNAISVYHMGVYADPALLEWFVNEFPKHSDRKLDMGKSCIRFKKPEHIPFKLIGELSSRMTIKDWVTLYESKLKR
jgi:uncharacterized protein YdhG (YjbR/CyaY superfamily)